MEAINNVAAQEKKLFQRFKRKMDEKERESMQDNEESKKDQEVENITQSEEHNRIQETENWNSISEAANLLDEIKDIQDELTILKTLLTQQQRIWQELVGPEPERDSARGPTYTLHEIEEMIKMAETVQKSLIFEHNNDGDTEYGPGWIFPIIFAVSAGIILPLMIYAAVGLGDLKNAFTKVRNRLGNISNESGKTLNKDVSLSSKAEEGYMAPGNCPTNHYASDFDVATKAPLNESPSRKIITT
ncbi:hypothetical protein BOTNAR_0377g00120 [Botryotinia narcissicola]|uniref:Uncharacterized protein n=1 Tax=Botryotinia narcissicola TaxID=278944 RepID=A0A4Z1HQ29_9HELO|nr:hypothetical protein BOTNAR_0377g00120 [Botryotinia narcissicola]